MPLPRLAMLLQQRTQTLRAPTAVAEDSRALVFRVERCRGKTLQLFRDICMHLFALCDSAALRAGRAGRRYESEERWL